MVHTINIYLFDSVIMDAVLLGLGVLLIVKVVAWAINILPG